MYELSIENYKGERLQLTQNPKYSVVKVDGLNPPTANINTAINANFDGASFKSSRVNSRNIVIDLYIEGDAEANRIELYNYIRVKRSVTVYYKNARRNVYIQGYVEALECGLFDKKQKAQISIVCPRPYFRDAQGGSVEVSNVQALFEFPFDIGVDGIEFSTLVADTEIVVTNDGDIETGFVLTLIATGSVVNPAVYNVDTGEYIKVDIELEEGDTLTISTVKGAKAVTLTRDGVNINAINYLDPLSTWLQLETGDNVLLYTAGSLPENATCSVVYDELFEGV